MLEVFGILSIRRACVLTLLMGRLGGVCGWSLNLELLEIPLQKITDGKIINKDAADKAKYDLYISQEVSI